MRSFTFNHQVYYRFYIARELPSLKLCCLLYTDSETIIPQSIYIRPFRTMSLVNIKNLEFWILCMREERFLNFHTSDVRWWQWWGHVWSRLILQCNIPHAVRAFFYLFHLTEPANLHGNIIKWMSFTWRTLEELREKTIHVVPCTT